MKNCSKQNQAISHSFARSVQKVDQTSGRLRDAHLFVCFLAGNVTITTLQNYEHCSNVLTRHTNHFIKSKNCCLYKSILRKTPYLFFHPKHKHQYRSQENHRKFCRCSNRFLCLARFSQQNSNALLISYFFVHKLPLRYLCTYHSNFTSKLNLFYLRILLNYRSDSQLNNNNNSSNINEQY